MEQHYPLTKQQEGLWIEWRLHPDNTSYNTCVKLRMTGDLDKVRFENALRDVVQFFSSLRVYFVEEGGVPFQRVKQEGEFSLEFEDLSVKELQIESPEQKNKAREFLERMLRTPVDLKSFPIVRAGLVKTTPNVHYFIGLVPHMISDGVSAILFLEATSIAYNQGYSGLEETYSADLKDWNDYFSEEKIKHNDQFQLESAAYWKSRMRGAQHAVDFTRNQKETSSTIKTGKRIYFDLTQELSKTLREYSRSQRTTLFSTLVSAFGVLLHRYFLQDDILIGYPVNIRPPGYKNLFGFFVNIIALRVDLSGDPTFEELVKRVSISRKADKKYQSFPALDIVREIRKTVSGFNGRVFNVSMAQTVSRLVNLRLDGISSEPLEAEYNDVNDDLSLSYELLENGRIGLWIEYRESLFSSDLIDQIIEHMKSLLQQTVDKPTQKISAYALLTEDECSTLLQEWSAPDSASTHASAKKTIHGLVEQYARANPSSTALVYQGREISYGQMNSQANRLARHIRGQGVSSGERVALCLERGPHMIFALIAVLKAGCTYVPIPPCFPKQRLEFILADSNARVVITEETLLGEFEAQDLRTIICADTYHEKSESLADHNLDIAIGGDDSAYIIYTSGSTGDPKGVLLSHGNVTPRLLWLRDEMDIDASDVVLQNTDYSFDVSVVEIFCPLMAGAKLILTETAYYKDPSYLINLIKHTKVTTAFFVPSLLNSILAVLKDQQLCDFKRVLAAGEALSPTLVNTFYKKCCGNLYNIYGPTEGAVYAAYKLCVASDVIDTVPIGRPISDTTLYILDQHQRPQPIDVVGELYIGGAGVAQGYVNQPTLTAEKFIADPFSIEVGARLYKTGDLAKFRHDGDIEYLGRIDAQVKIRGFRVELGEIESVISSFTGINDITVVDYGAQETHRRLVAYYVSKQNCDIEKLKEHIKRKLPDYMVPVFYISIETIPRLSSGKINRLALPNPEISIKKRAEYLAPSSDIEYTLVEIWARILKIPVSKIGIYDSFFDVGGDSLMAIQFVCEAEDSGLIFETNTLFTNSTVADLAKVICNEPQVKLVINQANVSGTYPLLPRQAKFFADGFEVPYHWNRFFFFDIDHDVNVDNLKTAFDRILVHHDNMRVSFVQSQDGAWLQDCAAEIPTTPYVFTHDLTALSLPLQEDEIIKLSNNYQASLDITCAPLLRVVHFKCSDTSGKLGIVIHHLLLDMVSSRIIFEDFIKVYEGLRLNLNPLLPTKTTSAKDWSIHLDTVAQEHDFSEELAYWGTSAMDPVPTLTRDFDDIGVAVESSSAQEIILLERDNTAELLQHIPSTYGINIQDFMLGCLLETSSEWTGEDDLVVNICGHGRDSVKGFDLTRTVAWANTVYPIHLSVKEEMKNSELDLFRGIQDQLSKVPSQNGHYNILRYTAKNPVILRNRTPDIFFNYVSQIDALLSEGISFQPVSDPAGIISASGENHLCYLLYIEAGVVDKCLNIRITYSQDFFMAKTISEFSHRFKDRIIDNLQALLLNEEALHVAS